MSFFDAGQALVKLSEFHCQLFMIVAALLFDDESNAISSVENKTENVRSFFTRSFRYCFERLSTRALYSQLAASAFNAQ